MGVVEGTLSAKPFALLLGELHASKVTGALRLQWGVGRRTIYFEKGCPVCVTGIPMMDNLGTMLLNERRIGPSVRAEALRRARVKNRPIGEALVELGALSEGELAECLGKQLENRLLEPFAWSGGDYGFTSGVRTPSRAVLPGGLDAVLRKALELGLACEPLDAWARASAGHELLPGARSADVDPRARRGADELAAITLAQSGVTVGEFLDRCDLERTHALRLLGELLALGRIAVSRTPKVQSLPPRPARTPPPDRIDEGRREKDGDNLIRLGRVCLSRAKAGRRGFAEAAEAYLLRAAELLPNNPDALVLLAELEQSRDNHELARRYQDKARRLGASSPARPRSASLERNRLKLAIGVFALAAAALLTAPRIWAEVAAPPVAAVETEATPARDVPALRTAELPPDAKEPVIKHVSHREAPAGSP